MRARARTFLEAFRARTEHFEVIYASKAFRAPPSTACSPTRASPRMWRPEASSTSPSPADTTPRLYMHGNNKSPAELNYAIERGIGHIVVDSFDEIERLRAAPNG